MSGKSIPRPTTSEAKRMPVEAALDSAVGRVRAFWVMRDGICQTDRPEKECEKAR